VSGVLSSERDRIAAPTIRMAITHRRRPGQRGGTRGARVSFRSRKGKDGRLPLWSKIRKNEKVMEEMDTIYLGVLVWTASFARSSRRVRGGSRGWGDTFRRRPLGVSTDPALSETIPYEPRPPGRISELELYWIGSSFAVAAEGRSPLEESPMARGLEGYGRKQ